MTKLFIADPLVLSQKSTSDIEKHERAVFKRMDELAELCRTKTRKEVNKEYPKNPAAPKFIWKDTPPKLAIMHIKRGNTMLSRTTISYNQIVTSEIRIPKIDREGKKTGDRIINQKGSPGKLVVEEIKW